MTFVGGPSDRPRHRPAFAAEFSGARPADAPCYAVDLGSLAAVRSFVDHHGRSAGLSAESVDDLVLAANELATNVVRHGGGSGLVWVWLSAGILFCQMSDRGAGMADLDHVGESPSSPNALAGRGLWMIRRMMDWMGIKTGPEGSTVTIAIRVAQ